MQHKKTIRIQTNDDFIDIQTNNIKNDLELQSQLIMNHTYWGNYHDFILEKIGKSNFSFKNISEWGKKIHQQNLLTMMFPENDFIAAQMISRNILSYNLIPQQINALDLSAYLNYSPDIICTNESNNFKFNKPSIVNKYLKHKAIDKREFKVLRVLDENHQIFIDLKVRGFNERKIITEILSLPFFWRNYHLISRTRVVDNFNDNIDYNLNSHLLQFYNPSSEYLDNVESSTTSPILYAKDYPAKWKQITSTQNQFNFMQLANQLIFTQPGIILPLTYRETRWSSMEKPDHIVRVNNKDANLISIKISGNKSREDNNKFFLNCVGSINSDDKHIASKLAINKILTNGQYILSIDGNIIYVYEQNILDIFQMLSIQDSQNNTL